MINWDAKNEVLVDYMGYPISRTEALAMSKQITDHLKKTPEQLAQIANEKLSIEHPKWNTLPKENYE